MNRLAENPMLPNALSGFTRSVMGAAPKQGTGTTSGGGKQSTLDETLSRVRAALPPPVIWLLGKTQSGKTSIIRSLTGSPDAEIGNGFQSCTRTARFYDHPADAPAVRFLDTQGLGEVDYDPTDDLAFCESQAQLIIAVVKASDSLQNAVFEVLRAVRRRHPEWPVILAQTCLHECCPAGYEHVLPYPFAEPGWEQRVPTDLTRSLLYQRGQLGQLAGKGPLLWIPLDLTQPEDAILPVDYGLEALWSGIKKTAQFGLEERLKGDSGNDDPFARAAHQQIIGFASASAALGALPLVDLAALPALQMRMLQKLGALAGVHWDKRRITEFSALLGPGIIAGYGLRMAGRSMVKLIPVLGQTGGAAFGAATGAALTFALGKAACLYLDRVVQGRSARAEEVRGVFDQAMHRGRELIRSLRLKSQS